MTASDVHLCEFGGYLWALLPRESKRFREEMFACGVPYRAGRLAYRMPTGALAHFLFLVRVYCPAWGVRQVGGCPPWVWTGLVHWVRDQEVPFEVLPDFVTDLDRMAGRLADAGAEVAIAPYEQDASQHLHVSYRGNFACAVFRDGGRFGQVFFGGHECHTSRYPGDVDEWLDIPASHHQGVRSRWPGLTVKER